MLLATNYFSQLVYVNESATDIFNTNANTVNNKFKNINKNNVSKDNINNDNKGNNY